MRSLLSRPVGPRAPMHPHVCRAARRAVRVQPDQPHGTRLVIGDAQVTSGGIDAQETGGVTAGWCMTDVDESVCRESERRNGARRGFADRVQDLSRRVADEPGWVCQTRGFTGRVEPRTPRIEADQIDPARPRLACRQQVSKPPAEAAAPWVPAGVRADGDKVVGHAEV